MSVVRWLLSAVYCTCFADQTTKSGQWVISSSKQVHYTSDNSHLTSDKFRRLPDFFHSSIDRAHSSEGISRQCYPHVLSELLDTTFSLWYALDFLLEKHQQGFTWFMSPGAREVVHGDPKFLRGIVRFRV